MTRVVPNTIPTRLLPQDARPSWRALLSSPSRALPNFLIIGAQKSGTSSLHDQLDRHPAIWMAPCKECNYFTGRRRSALGYRAFFARRSSLGAIGVTHVGESTPYYLFHPAVPPRVDAMLPGVKAIAVLRNPVDRAWSHYRHNVRLGIETLEFEDALDAEEERTRGEAERVASASNALSHQLRHFSYAARGEYVAQLARWFDALGRERVLVLTFEQLVGETREVMTSIAGFLGVDDVVDDALPRRNVGEAGATMSDDARARLAERFDEPNRRLTELLQIEVDW